MLGQCIWEEKSRRYQDKKDRLGILEKDAKSWHKSQRL
jgi:hypothetical protein